MIFERLALQVWAESNFTLGSSEAALPRKSFESLVAKPSEQIVLADAGAQDAICLACKAVLTFSSAVRDLASGSRSWGVVKLYYAVFYATRSILLSNGHAMVRNFEWYRIDLNLLGQGVDSPALRLTGDRFRNDHKAVLNFYFDKFNASDILLSNTVSGINPFEWLMSLREVANYRASRFSDPKFPHDVLSVPLVISDQLDDVLISVLNDDRMAASFQPELAWIALPLRFVEKSVSSLQASAGKILVDDCEISHFFEAISWIPGQVAEKFKPLSSRLKSA